MTAMEMGYLALIVGALTFAAEPMPLPELALTLKVSKAAVSIHIRTLRQIGLVEKVSFPGDRRDFYLLHRDFERGMLDSTVKEVRDGVYILDKTLAALADRAVVPGEEIVARRLTSLCNLYSQVGRMIEDLCREWSARKGQAPDGSGRSGR